MKKKKIILRAFLLIALFLFVFSGGLLAQAKKVRVIAASADIHLNADERSPVVATVEKGTVLTLRHPRAIKRIWLHVYASQEKAGLTKSGYILESVVERLFEGTRIETIRDESLLVTHFRQAHWGMSKERVFELEGEPVYQRYAEGLERVGFRKEVRRLDCLVEYIFSSEKLVQARYIFQVKRRFPNEYIGDYRKVRDFLVEQHGEPEKSEVIWLNDLYKEDYSRWGEAIRQGHMEYFAFWKMKETEVYLRLFGENEEIKLETVYTGVQFAMKETVRQRFRKDRMSPP